MKLNIIQGRIEQGLIVGAVKMSGVASSTIRLAN